MNLQKDKWFIRVPDEESAKAVQEYMFERGLAWAGKQELRTDYDTWSFPMAIGAGHYGGDSLGQASIGWWESQGHKEIFITFKTVVDKVEFPKVESPQEIKIRELEATIAKAYEQIKALKEEI